MGGGGLRRSGGDSGSDRGGDEVGGGGGQRRAASPSPAPAPVYIANHASQVDLAAVYYIMRHFKWVAKESVLFIPGVGQTMYLGNHVFVRRSGRGKRSSVASLYERSNEAVRSGTSMFLFPQGTRGMGPEALPFKDGAFKIALENGCPIVPISIEIPPGVFNGWYPLNLLWGVSASEKKKDPVILTVHKTIMAEKGGDLKELKRRCRDVIYSVLPKYDGGEEVETEAGGMSGEPVELEDKKVR